MTSKGKIHCRQIGKQQLQQHHQDDTTKNPAITEQPDPEHGVTQGTTVKQIENFTEDKDIDRTGPCCDHTAALMQFPLEQSE